MYIYIDAYVNAHTGYTGTKPPRRSQGVLNFYVSIYVHYNIRSNDKYPCWYIYIYIYIYMNMCIYIHIFIYTCLYMFIQICIYASMTYIYIHVYIL